LYAYAVAAARDDTQLGEDVANVPVHRPPAEGRHAGDSLFGPVGGIHHGYYNRPDGADPTASTIVALVSRSLRCRFSMRRSNDLLSSKYQSK
jgi:hypothetical protein